jgi:hypothetical protein
LALPLTVLVSFALAASDAEMAHQIVAYAHSKIGEKVGGGECSELVFEALHAAGADPFDRSQVRASLADAKPGDVLDFQGAEFRGKTSRTKTYWYRFEQHAAIVVSTHWKGKTLQIKVLHQNVGLQTSKTEERERVSEQTLNLGDLVAGEITAYRPVSQKRSAHRHTFKEPQFDPVDSNSP